MACRLASQTLCPVSEYMSHGEEDLRLTGGCEGCRNECQGEESKNVHSVTECLVTGGWDSSSALRVLFI